MDIEDLDCELEIGGVKYRCKVDSLTFTIPPMLKPGHTRVTRDLDAGIEVIERPDGSFEYNWLSE